MFINPRQPVMYYDARLIDVVRDPDVHGSDRLVFEYQGQTVEQPTLTGAAEKAEQDKAEGRPVRVGVSEVGQIGFVMQVGNEDRQFRQYRFDAYIDQSLRRAFDLDPFAHLAAPFPAFNMERIGWRNSLCPDGFLAPAGIIPGEDGRFIEDSTEALELAVPQEFADLCKQYKLTPEAVLRGFIADAAELRNFVREPRADGYSSNGSDERRLAGEYLERAYGMWRED